MRLCQLEVARIADRMVALVPLASSELATSVFPGWPAQCDDAP